MRDIGNYDVAVVGAGVTGIVASVAAAQTGARTCLIESSSNLGGLITGGRLTKPTGVIQPGVYDDLVHRAAKYGGADPSIRVTNWGSYSGVFDAEVMQRVIIEALDEAGVDIVLNGQAIDVLSHDASVRGVQLQAKSGTALVRATNTVDTSGDGDVAALAGAEFMFGRPSDGLTQPMTSYLRIINVDMPKLIKYCAAHPEDMIDLVLPDDLEGSTNGSRGVIMNDFFARGFVDTIKRARAAGFDWTLPKRHITLKTGMLEGEININATRVHGNALDPIERSNATVEVRRQAYCVLDLMKEYVPGFENSLLLEVSSVLGIRETRRILGDYVITEADARGAARFPDAIGLCTDPIDIHEPGGEGGTMDSVGEGYGMPYRSLLPKGLENILVAGRCISVDSTAYGSTRNTPACALTGQAAGTAAALAAAAGVTPRELPIEQLQQALERIGVVLGSTSEDRAPHLVGV